MMNQIITNSLSPSLVTKTSESILTDASTKQPAQCLLIVFGAPERLQALRAILQSTETVITCCDSIDKIHTVGLIGMGKYDLVIVDVEPKRVVSILRIVRNREMRAGIPVLVESGRLHTEPDLAGVLPRFRAMPCHFTELLKLARHLLSRELPYRSEHFGTPRTL